MHIDAPSPQQMQESRTRDAVNRLHGLIHALRNTRIEPDMVLLRREIKRECALCPKAYERLKEEINGVLPGGSIYE